MSDSHPLLFAPSDECCIQTSVYSDSKWLRRHPFSYYINIGSVRARMCACVRACVRACVCVCVVRFRWNVKERVLHEPVQYSKLPLLEINSVVNLAYAQARITILAHNLSLIILLVVSVGECSNVSINTKAHKRYSSSSASSPQRQRPSVRGKRILAGQGRNIDLHRHLLSHHTQVSFERAVKILPRKLPTRPEELLQCWRSRPSSPRTSLTV